MNVAVDGKSPLKINHYPSGLISEPPSFQHSFLLQDEIARFNGRRDIDLFSRTNDQTHQRRRRRQQQQHDDDDDDDHNDDDDDDDDDEKILSAIV